MVLHRLSSAELQAELGSVRDRCDPPERVWAWIDSTQTAGELLGRSDARGLVLITRNLGRGEREEVLTWIRCDHIRQRRDDV